MERGLRLVDHNNIWYRVITTNVARMAECTELVMRLENKWKGFRQCNSKPSNILFFSLKGIYYHHNNSN